MVRGSWISVRREIIIWISDFNLPNERQKKLAAREQRKKFLCGCKSGWKKTFIGDPLHMYNKVPRNWAYVYVIKDSLFILSGCSSICFAITGVKNIVHYNGMFLIWDLLVRGFAILEIFRFYDEGDYECKIFSILSSASVRASVILAGKRYSHRHSTTRFCGNTSIKC